MFTDLNKSFPRLQKFAAFLLNGHSEEFNRDYLRRLKDADIPMLQLDILKKMSDEELEQTILKSTIDNFLLPVSEGKGLYAAMEGTNRWKTYVKENENPADLSISDLIIAYETRTVSLMKFLPLYEDYSFEMFSEIQEFSKDCQEITYRTFVEIFEQRITENELFVQKVTDASPNILFLFDLKKHEYLYISKNIREILGYSESGFIEDFHAGKESKVHPDDIQKMQDRLASFTGSENERQVTEFRMQHADGHYLWMRAYDTVYKRDTSGMPVQIVSSIIDVTDRKNAEEALKSWNIELEKRVDTQTRELQNSYNQLKEVLESLPQMAWTADAKGNIEYYSSTWIRYLGVSFEELRSQGWVGMLHPDDMQHTINAFHEGVQQQKAFTIENRIKRGSDGAFRWHVSMGLPLKDEQGNITKWVGTTTDIHDQKTLTEQLEKKVTERTAELLIANAELERSNKDLEQFAYVASHDLKEPLRMVSSYLQLLSNTLKGKLDNEQLEFLGFVNSGADRMNDLIKDLLNYSRIIKDPGSLQKIDSNHIIDIVKQNLERLIEDTGAAIITHNLPEITGIESQQTQLFQNLVANAIKFRSPQRSPVIEISARAEKGQWLFSVKDNGIGIESRFLDKIFVIFQRLHNRTDYPGTGIGLSVCKKIVELYGGKIWCESVYGEGSTFWFTIPKVISHLNIEEESMAM